MNLLYLHNTPLNAAKANIIQVLHMCDAFARLGAEVTLALPEGTYKLTPAEIRGLIESRLNRQPGFRVAFFRKATPFGRLKSLGGFAGAYRFLKKTKTDLCLVRTPFFRLTTGLGIPTILESHNTRLNFRYRLADRYWKRQLMKRIDSPHFLKMVTISHALGRFWREYGVPEEKLLVAHDGVDPSEFVPEISRTAARQALELPLEPRIVVYAGSLYPDREIETVLELAVLHPEALFIVIGGPEKRKQVYEKIAAQENVENISFVGYIPHVAVRDYLFAADVLLMIWSRKVRTIHICSPLKMFEYMAAGRVIVGHDFPVIREVLDEDTAYLADPDSPVDLHARLNAALDEPFPSARASRARKKVLKDYTWEQRARSILASVGM